MADGPIAQSSPQRPAPPQPGTASTTADATGSTTATAGTDVNGTTKHKVKQEAAQVNEQVKQEISGVKAQVDQAKANVQGETPSHDPSLPPEKAKEKKAPASEASKSVDPQKVQDVQDKAKAAAKKIPEPDYTGWKEVGGWDERTALSSKEEADDLLARSTLLENYISEKYYGDWYHNTALIVLTAFFSWLVARLGGGLAWLAIVLAFAATAYRTSIRRLRRNTRDDLAREAAVKKLETDVETMDWLNTFLGKFWLIYEPVLAETVISIGNQVMSGIAAPPPIESVSLSTFTLGTKPPRIDGVRSFPKTKDDVAVMDWRFSFTPNDTEDLTARQLKTKVNPKVALSVRIGKGVVSKGMPILVEDMSFSGHVRVRIKMMTAFPHIQIVDVSFLEPPEFDFVLKPIGGDTFGFDINIIPGLSGFIKEMVHSTIGPMFYAPNAFQLNVQQMLAGSGIDSAVGVLAVTVYNARGLKGSEALGNTVDPYIKFSFNERDEQARTDVKSDTKNPTWNETKYLLVRNLTEVLTMQLVDFNEYRKDKPIGVVNFAMETLVEKPDQQGISSPVLNAGKERGQLVYDVHWFPVLEGKTLDDGTVEPPPVSNTGIVRFTVHQCKELDTKVSMVGQVSPYAEMLLNNRVVNVSKTIKRSNEPVWDESYEMLVTNRNTTKLAVNIRDSRGLAQDPMIGSYKVSLSNLLSSIQQGNDWFGLTPSGRVRMSATWKPLGLKASAGGSSYIEPIGVFRFHFKGAKGLPNLETLGKIDPYMRVFVGGFQRGRIDYVDDDDSPVWDDIMYVTVQNPTQKVVLEAMDNEGMSKDRSLGLYEFNAQDYVTKNEKGEYLPSELTDKVSRVSLNRKPPKGDVSYSVQFLPAVPVLDPEEAKERKKEAEKKEAERQEAIARGEDPDKEEKEKKEKEEKEKAKAKAAKTEDDSDEEDEEEEQEETVTEQEPLDLSVEQLKEYHSGVLSWEILSVEGLGGEGYLRVLVDESIFPAYISNKIKTRNAKVVETGEAMIRELEWSEVRFEVSTKEYPKKHDDVFAQLSIPTMQLLDQTYGAPKVFTLTGRSSVKVTLSTRYFPVLMKLDPRESISNQGVVTVEVLDAAGLPAADRSGKSDPYAKFSVNKKNVFKTKTVKKTLSPQWNEKFETSIGNRIGDDFSIDIFDWDMGPAEDDFLGHARIPVADLEPLAAQEREIKLVGEKGEDAGVARLRLLFKPGFIIKSRHESGMGTFSNVAGAGGQLLGTVGNGAAGAVGAVGGAGTKAVGGAFGIASGGVHKGGSFIKRGFGGRKHKSNQSVDGSAADDDEGDVSAQSLHSTTSNRLGRSGSLSSGVSNAVPGGGEARPGQVTIISASGFENVHNLQLRVSLFAKREKELFKSKHIKFSDGQASLNESIPFKGPVDGTLLFRARDHKSLGRDEELGEASLVIGESAGSEHRVSIAGHGEVVVYVNFQA